MNWDTLALLSESNTAFRFGVKLEQIGLVEGWVDLYRFSLNGFVGTAAAHFFLCSYNYRGVLIKSD